jgi:16S rRNA (cytidine1402-2'-O)-methyltransferase
MRRTRAAEPSPGIGSAASAQPGTLYLVATPIGNLEDISARALRIMASVACICAEDTRVTRKLLAHFEIRTPLISLHEHSGETQIERLAERLKAGESMALVTDAGTPGVSDPGGRMVRRAVQIGAAVSPIPGPSAVLSALVVSSLPTGRFCFDGFPPRTRSDRRQFFENLAAEQRTIVLYESPVRLRATLAELLHVLGDRSIAVCRELTKVHEEIFRGTISQAAAHYANTARGEFTLVIAGAPPPARGAGATELEDLISRLLQAGKSVKDAASEAAAKLSCSRRDAYQAALALHRRQSDS